MKGVDTIAWIRREFFVRSKAIKELIRELHVSRNTMRKVLRSGAMEFTYGREVQPLPTLGRWKGDLDRLAGGKRGEASAQAVDPERAGCRAHHLWPRARHLQRRLSFPPPSRPAEVAT